MKLILPVATLIFFLSCDKNEDSPISDNATLSYKVHDSTITIPNQGANIYMNKTGIFGTYEYAFSGSYKNAQSQLEGFTFVALTDSLKEGAYIFDSTYFATSNKEFSTIGLFHDGIPYLPPTLIMETLH